MSANEAQRVFTLAHVSDIHLSPLPKVRRRQLLSKRLLGYVNWHRGRKFVHKREILDLLADDLKERGPDHIVVTGDLTNLALPQEFPPAAVARDHLEHATAELSTHEAGRVRKFLDDAIQAALTGRCPRKKR